MLLRVLPILLLSIILICLRNFRELSKNKFISQKFVHICNAQLYNNIKHLLRCFADSKVNSNARNGHTKIYTPLFITKKSPYVLSAVRTLKLALNLLFSK